MSRRLSSSTYPSTFSADSPLRRRPPEPPATSFPPLNGFSTVNPSATSQRLSNAFQTLDQLRTILDTHCSRSDEFGTLALTVVEKGLEPLKDTIGLIQNASTITLVKEDPVNGTREVVEEPIYPLKEDQLTVPPTDTLMVSPPLIPMPPTPVPLSLEDPDEVEGVRALKQEANEAMPAPKNEERNTERLRDRENGRRERNDTRERDESDKREYRRGAERERDRDRVRERERDHDRDRQRDRDDHRDRKNEEEDRREKDRERDGDGERQRRRESRRVEDDKEKDRRSERRRGVDSDRGEGRGSGRDEDRRRSTGIEDDFSDYSRRRSLYEISPDSKRRSSSRHSKELESDSDLRSSTRRQESQSSRPPSRLELDQSTEAPKLDLPAHSLPEYQEDEKPRPSQRTSSLASASSRHDSPDDRRLSRERLDDEDAPTASRKSTRTSSSNDLLSSINRSRPPSPEPSRSRHRKDVPSLQIDTPLDLSLHDPREPEQSDRERLQVSERSSHRRKSTKSSDSESSSISSSGEGGRRRTKSRHRGYSEDTQSALSLASAPPPDNRPPVVLDNPKVFHRLGEILAKLGVTATLASLAMVSKVANAELTPILYDTVTLKSLASAKALESTLVFGGTQSSLVRQLVISPLDVGTPVDLLDVVLPPLKTILQVCSNLKKLDEDFTTSDWDVRLPADYPLTATSTAQPQELVSRRCWWEIGAVNELLKAQTSLEHVIFHGAVMDRDWEGQRLLKRPVKVAFPSLGSIEIAQVAHEDTLVVLLRSCGPSLQSLRIGFQSIGPTDNDTPLSAIAPALAQVGEHLIHFAIRAPLQSAEDTSSLLEACVAVLPRLEILEFSEQGESQAVSMATNGLLSRLPPLLRILRARGLVSISTDDVLNMLNNPDTIPVLEELDLKWAIDAGKKKAWDEAQREQIEVACIDMGLRCQVDRNDEPLEFRRQKL